MKTVKGVTSCDKRHNKECRKFFNSKCRFNKDWAYKYSENLQELMRQTKLDKSVAIGTIKNKTKNLCVKHSSVGNNKRNEKHGGLCKEMSRFYKAKLRSPQEVL